MGLSSRTKKGNKLSSSSSREALDSQTPPLPGPSGLPCIGSMLEWKGPRTNLEWTRQYGKIYHVKMGGKDLVYLSSLDIVKEHLEGKKGDVFLDRTMGPAAIGEGLLFGSGRIWQKNKRAMMKALHTRTFSPQLESAVLNETSIALDKLYALSMRSTYTKPGDVLLQACANSIAGLLCGGNLPEDSQHRKDLSRVARDLQGCDLTSMLTQITLKVPKLREPLSKLFFTDIVDVHGTSRRLQRLLRQWIRQARSGTLTPTPTNSKPLPNFMPTRRPKLSRASTTQSDDDSGIHTKCPRLRSDRDTSDSDDASDFASEDTSGVYSDGAEASLNSSRQFSSEESLLAMPRDESLIDQAMKNATQLAVFGFIETGRGEMPYELPEPRETECPVTPLIQSQWNFQQQLSVNPGEDSILQRLLQQPEFDHVTEENDAELLQVLIDMFFGGVTSTLSAVEWTLFFLTQNASMQEHAQREIDNVLSKSAPGAEHTVTWEMRDQMPYIRACITEALRLGSVTPSSLPHVATKDTEIEGYPISAGTMVVASIISLHYDPKEYLDAAVFRPQRHIGPDGEYQAPTSYRPYGIGARRCVGDQLSEMQIFLYTTNILHRFNLKPTGSKKFDSQDTHMRIVHRLKDFRCRLECRELS